MCEEWNEVFRDKFFLPSVALHNSLSLRATCAIRAQCTLLIKVGRWVPVWKSKCCLLLGHEFWVQPQIYSRDESQNGAKDPGLYTRLKIYRSNMDREKWCKGVPRNWGD